MIQPVVQEVGTLPTREILIKFFMKSSLFATNCRKFLRRFTGLGTGSLTGIGKITGKRAACRFVSPRFLVICLIPHSGAWSQARALEGWGGLKHPESPS